MNPLHEYIVFSDLSCVLYGQSKVQLYSRMQYCTIQCSIRFHSNWSFRCQGLLGNIESA